MLPLLLPLPPLDPLPHNLRPPIPRLQVASLQRELSALKSSVANADVLRREVHHLNRELLAERTKVKALGEELENPLNVHRWAQGGREGGCFLLGSVGTAGSRRWGRSSRGNPLSCTGGPFFKHILSVVFACVLWGGVAWAQQQWAAAHIGRVLLLLLLLLLLLSHSRAPAHGPATACPAAAPPGGASWRAATPPPTKWC